MNETREKLMKIYLASRYSRFKEMQGYRAELEALGHVVTSRWINGGHQIDDAGLSLQAKEAERIRFASEDRDDLLAADCVISFTEVPRASNSRGGRHVEHGMALALGKRVIVVGHQENVFHCLPEVLFFPTWDAALPAIAVAAESPSPSVAEAVEVEPFGYESGTPWPGQAPTANALAEAIAEMAINNRSGLIQRVRGLIIRDRATVRARFAHASRRRGAMSVGGKIIEIGPHVLRDADDPAFRRDVIRLWVIDRNGAESVIYAEPATELPRVGEDVWWSSGVIYFANDHCKLKKVGYSTDPTMGTP